MILGYARCSTAEQAAEGTSTMENQDRAIRGVAMIKGMQGFDIAIYADPGVSGAISLAKRPAGAQLLADAKAKDTIIAAKLDRIFRSASDALVTVEKLQERKIDLILADIGIDPVTSNGMGKLFFSMLASFAEFERHRIAERISDGKKAKKAKGGHLGGYAPFGYCVVGSGRQTVLEPFEDEQQVIRFARELAQTHRPGKICQKLTEAGFRNRAGNQFQICHVIRMLERGSYAEI